MVVGPWSQMRAGQELRVALVRCWRDWSFWADFRAAFRSGPDLTRTERASAGVWKEEERWFDIDGEKDEIEMGRVQPWRGKSSSDCLYKDRLHF